MYLTTTTMNAMVLLPVDIQGVVVSYLDDIEDSTNLMDCYGWGLACLKGNRTMVESSLGNFTFSALTWIYENMHIDPSADNNYAIIQTSSLGKIECVRLLLKDPRVDPSDRGSEALICASEYGHAEVVRLLLADPRVDPSVDNHFPLQIAAANGHGAVARLLANAMCT